MRRTALILGSLLSSIVIVGTANAIPISPGVLSTLTNGSDYTAAPTAADVGSGAFTFDYLFDVATNVTTTIFASSHQPFPGAGDPSITNLRLSWLDSSQNPLPGASSIDVTNGTGQTIAGKLIFALVGITQAGADYILRVTGTATNGGRYDFDVLGVGAGATTPVPLSSAALFFGGALAGLGLIMRRRNKSTRSA